MRGLLLPSRARLGVSSSEVYRDWGIEVQDPSIAHLQRQALDLEPEITFTQQTRLKNERPYSWPLFTLIYQGDVVGATDLIKSGQASASDVDPYGLGVSYVGDPWKLKA